MGINITRKKMSTNKIQTLRVEYKKLPLHVRQGATEDPTSGNKRDLGVIL